VPPKKQKANIIPSRTASQLWPQAKDLLFFNDIKHIKKHPRFIVGIPEFWNGFLPKTAIKTMHLHNFVATP
jgi:hypothetical protein